MVPPGDVTAIPSDVGKENVTLVTTSFSNVTSLPSDVALENVSSSDALQQGLGIETSTGVAMETASSSDVPLDDVTKEVTDIVTREGTDSKLKLHRQFAVTEEDTELPTPALVVSSQPSGNVDNITTSLNGLSIGMDYICSVCMYCMYA